MAIHPESGFIGLDSLPSIVQRAAQNGNGLGVERCGILEIPEHRWLSIRGGSTTSLSAIGAYVGRDVANLASIRLADLNAYKQHRYDPIAELKAQNAVDRYAAVKALQRREDLRAKAVPALEALLAREAEERVALEAAAAAAVLGSHRGQDKIGAALWGSGAPESRMEA
jgi:hypothetical protein